MTEENKAIVRRMVEAVQNEHNLDSMDTFFTPNFINHVEAPGHTTEGTSVERAKSTFRQLFAAIPDLHATIHAQVAEGDKVVTYKTMRGTHQGEWMGVAPSGRTITFNVIDILRLEDGKVVEHWAVQDRLAVMQQLGLLDAPAPAH